MKDEEKLTYLANAYGLARANRLVAPQEEHLLESIRKAAGAKKDLLEKAKKRAGRSDFKIKPVGRFSDKVRNLEEMLLVALSDGDVDEEEKRLILAFAGEVGISQAQLNTLFAESKERVKEEIDEATCFSCGKKVSATSTHCPDCRAYLKAKKMADRGIVGFDVPKKGVSIAFAKFPTSDFGKIVKLAGGAPEFQERLRSKKPWYLSGWPAERMSEAIELAGRLVGNRNRKVYINGKELPWDEVFGFLWCWRQRSSSKHPREYCFGHDERRLNIWGCKQADMDWTEWSDWLSLGKFQNDKSFVFDKKRIGEKLQRNLTRVRFCPHLEARVFKTAFRLFPEKVTVTKGGPWKYKERFGPEPGAIKITKRLDTGAGRISESEFYADGVSPVGHKEAMRLINAVAAKCGMKPLDFKELEIYG